MPSIPAPRAFTFGSVCSGIGSEVLAWRPLGWVPRWFSEIDPFCSRLLWERYAAYSVPNLGDATKIVTPPKVDLVVGGTPCQSFSVNARGDGLADPRGQLSLSFIRIVDRVKPRWVLWENVENALRVDKGRAFGSIVGALGEIGYGWAYRVFDLRGFGIPQRRRRLFLVGHRGRSAQAFAALFNRPSPSALKGQVCETRSDYLERVRVSFRDSGVLDGWSGDETPKREQVGVPTLKTGQGGEGTGWILDRRELRRLTVTEYEKLQGFPPGYTDITFGGKPASPRRRCRALGNAFPPPILYWIGQHINAMHAVG